MAKYVTIMDIARVLGISKSTVSRALSGDTGNVKAETLQKILATAEQMGYHRNELAVHLRQQSTHRHHHPRNRHHVLYDLYQRGTGHPAQTGLQGDDSHLQ